jgi:hypothetical protein
LPPEDQVLDPARLPPDWLGSTSLRAVIVGPGEWTQLADAQQAALLTWAACGGDLIVVDGDLATLFPGDDRPAPATGSGAARYYFGHIHLPELASVEAGGLIGTLAAADAAVADANWTLPVNRADDWGAIAGRGFRLLIPDVEGVPARMYLSILIAFALIVGPANYWLLWRRRQQVLLVLTAPVIATVFIGVLAGYVVLGEGIGVRGRAASLTLLDQGTKRAATRGTVSLYAAGMAPGGGLVFPRDVAVIPIGPDGQGSRAPQRLDLTDAQRFSAGLMQARAPSNFEIVGFRPARERLTLTRTGDGLTVVNGLGATVTQLVYRDGETAHTLAVPLASGAQVGLETRAWTGAEATGVTQSLPLRLERVFTHQPSGSDLAVHDRSPILDLGVEDVEERGSDHIVLGIPERRP